MDLSTQFDEPPPDNTGLAVNDIIVDVDVVQTSGKTTSPPHQTETSTRTETPTRTKERSIILKVPIADSIQSSIAFMPLETSSDRTQNSDTNNKQESHRAYGTADEAL